MPRYFSPITTDELAAKIIAAAKRLVQATPKPYVYEHASGCGPDGVIDFMVLTPKIEKDLQKISFDGENLEIDPARAAVGWGGYGLAVGFCNLPNGLSYLGIAAGGDWEWPVFFIIYWDGKALRAYVPTDGNLWNSNTKAAFGNGPTHGPDSDVAYFRKIGLYTDPDDDEFDLDAMGVNGDPAKLQGDIIKRIIKK